VKRDQPEDSQQRCVHPMSWLAVTFTTQEINSLILSKRSVSLPYISPHIFLSALSLFGQGEKGKRGRYYGVKDKIRKRDRERIKELISCVKMVNMI